MTTIASLWKTEGNIQSWLKCCLIYIGLRTKQNKQTNKRQCLWDVMVNKPNLPAVHRSWSPHRLLGRPSDVMHTFLLWALKSGILVFTWLAWISIQNVHQSDHRRFTLTAASQVQASVVWPTLKSQAPNCLPRFKSHSTWIHLPHCCLSSSL